MTDLSVEKLFVVPQNIFNDLHSMPRRSYQSLLRKPEVQHLSNVDQELREILYDPTVPEDIKHQKYMAMLNLFDVSKRRIPREPVKVQIQQKALLQPKLEGVAEPPANEDEIDDLTLGDWGRIDNKFAEEAATAVDLYGNIDNVLEASNLPLSAQANAKALLTHLEKNPHINWDASSGEIYVNEQPIPNSNIVNTIQDFMRDRKKAFPGFEEVGAQISNSDFPKKLIVNKKLWNHYKLGAPNKAPNYGMRGNYTEKKWE